MARRAAEGLREQPDAPVKVIARQAGLSAERRGQIAPLGGEVARLKARVVELEEQNRPPAASFRRARAAVLNLRMVKIGVLLALALVG